MTVAQEIPKVAGILGMSEDALLREMTSHFIKEKIVDSERRIGKFHLKEQKLRHKYQMNLEELAQILEKLESAEDYEGQTINGIPVLEAVADTRTWEHLLENLAEEEKKLSELTVLVQL